MQITMPINKRISLTLEMDGTVTPKEFVRMAETIKRIEKQEGFKGLDAKPEKKKNGNGKAQEIAMKLMKKGKSNKEINAIMKKKGYTNSNTFASDTRYALKQKGYRL